MTSIEKAIQYCDEQINERNKLKIYKPISAKDKKNNLLLKISIMSFIRMKGYLQTLQQSKA